MGCCCQKQASCCGGTGAWEEKGTQGLAADVVEVAAGLTMVTAKAETEMLKTAVELSTKVVVGYSLVKKGDHSQASCICQLFTPSHAYYRPAAGWHSHRRQPPFH